MKQPSWWIPSPVNKEILANNFLVTYGSYVEEVGVKQVPEKPRKTYRWKESESRADQ